MAERDPDILNDVPMAEPGEASRWLDDPSNAKKIVWAVVIVAGAAIAIDPLIHKHPYFEIERWPGFYGVVGFVACMTLGLGSRAVRWLVMRPEGYYAKGDPDDR